MATALNFDKHGRWTEYDFSANTAEECDVIATRYRTEAQSAQIAMLIWTVTSVAMGYIAFLGLTSLFSTYGILATGLAIVLLPICLRSAQKQSKIAAHCTKQAEIVELHKCNFSGKGIKPEQM